MLTHIESFKTPTHQYFNMMDESNNVVSGVGVFEDENMHHSFKDKCKTEPDKCALIVYVHTSKNNRKKGYATKLLKKVVEEYKDWDLFLEVIPQDKTNTVYTLTKFYQKFGFERCETCTILPIMIKPAIK